MTRKKSNVKALALAVTCAILAGGYSGLNPVYAVDYYTVKYDTNNWLNYEVPNTSGGYNTNGIYKIKLNDIVLDSSIGASPSITVGSYFSIDGSGGSISAAGNKFTVSGAGAITATSLSLGTMNDVAATINSKAAQTDVDTNSVNIQKLEGKTTNISYNATTGTTVDGVVLKDKGITAADGKFTVDGTNGKTVVKGGNGTVTIDPAGDGILYTRTVGSTTQTIQLDSGYVDASGYVKAPKFYIDNDNKFEKNSLSVAGVDSNGNQQYVRIGGGTITTSDDVNVSGTLYTNTIGEATTGTGVTVDGVKFNAGAVSGVSGINDDILQFTQNGTENIVQINSDLRLNDNTGGKAAILSVEGLAALNSMVYDATGKINNDAAGKPIIQAGNGSVVGGVKLDNKNIANVDSITVNEGKENQVQITSEGIVVGLTSAAINGDGFYAGGHNYNDAKAALDGKDGKIKGAGGKFGVDEYGNVTTTANIKGKDITAEGNLTVDGDAEVKKDLKVTGNIVGQDITANGALKGKTLGIGGTANDKFTVDEDGAVKAAGGKVEIDKTGKATFGDTAGGITKIEGQKITTGSIVANDTTVESTISGVKMKNGLITADSMKITGTIDLNDLTVNNKLTVGTFSVDKDGVVGGVKSINGANVTASGTGLTIGSATVGAANPFSSTGFTVDATGNITAGTYNGNTIGADNKFNGVELKGGDVKATKVTADTITDGTAIMTGGTVTANTITVNTSASLAGVTFDASGVDFNGKDIKNVANVTATTAKLGNLSIAGHVIKNDVEAGGPIGLGTTVTVNNAGELDRITKIDGVAVGAVTGGNGLEFGGNAIIGATGKPFSSTGFNVDDDGDVTGKSFKVNGSNYLDSTGLTTENAVIGGVNTLDNKGIDTSGKLHVGGQATFGDSTGTHTTINGGTITSTDGTDSTTIGPKKIKTKTLEADTIILNDHMQDGAGNKIEIGADGHLNVAGNNFKIDTIGQLTNEYAGNDAAGKTTKTTLKTSVDGIKANYTNSVNDNNNLLNINKDGVALGVTDSSNNNLGMLSADASAATMGYGTANSIVVSADTIKSALGTDVTRVMTNSATEQSIVDAVGTTTVTTNGNGTTFGDGTANNTLIYGSAITSTNGVATGVLDGSNLTLKNGTNSTVMNAGGATFTGAAGEKGGTQTIINGGTITTDTLNVERINLGGEVIDKGAAGVEANSKLYMDAQGNFRAAGGNFKVNGADGAMTNTVGNTTLTTDTTGASMNYAGTANSNISVADGKAEMAVGANAAVTATDGKVEIKGGTQNVTTTDAGTVFENSAHNTPFGGGSETKTTINGNEITTGKITTDQLVIKGNGSGAAAGAGTGTIALGGDGSITSNIKDAATGKEATFKTDEKGTFTEAKDSAGNKTTNTVNAQGNTNEVTDGTNTSTATQKATSIGGVITNGTVELAKAELNKDGFTVKQKDKTDVKIADGDVTVTNNRNTTDSRYANQTVNLSDLGSLNNLDGELTARDEYKNNQTAVGAINAEAGIRREEVARLDNRIDDVNNRVDKVGAMAAAIASLKSIGYDPQAPSEFSIGLGQYKGETGVAMGFFHYPNKNFMINVSLSTAGGETMGGIGATWRFGHKSPQKLLDEQREAQAKKELAAAEKYQAAAKLAKEAQERAEYAAKLARQAQVSADNAKAAADATQAKHF